VQFGKGFKFQEADLFMLTKTDDKNVIMNKAFPAALLSKGVVCFPPQYAVLIFVNSEFSQSVNGLLFHGSNII
jgi:hypothetical protein